MAIERFSAGEPVSARKFNNLVCALNNLCTSARNLQRGQTLPLGVNNRPRRFFGSAGCGGSGCGTCFEACVCYRAIESAFPPFTVMRIFTTSELHITGGFWKYGKSASTSIGGLGCFLSGFYWFEGRYIYIRSDGTLVASDCSTYDHRFYRLLADVCTYCTDVFRINICQQLVCVAFPKQYWVGDICQPIPRWSQGGVFKNCLTREGKLRVYNGMVYVESPLAVAGRRTLVQCGGGLAVADCACTLRIVQGYYPVPCTTLDVPKEDLILMLRYKSCGTSRFSGIAGTFEWYWTCAEKARSVHKCDVPVFEFSQALTSEFLDNNRGCWIGSGSPVNYSYDGSGSWGVSIPMGRSYKGICGALCARVSQKVPEFRARPIMNFWNACVCLPTCDIHRATGSNSGFALNGETALTLSRLLMTESRSKWLFVPDHVVITYCTCDCDGGDDTEPASTVYKAPKQNTISETYYTNGNT